MKPVCHLYVSYMENVRQNIFNIDSSYMLDICSIYGTYNLHIWDIQATYMQHACSIYAGYTAHNMRHTSHLNATYISHACSIYAAYMAHIICIYEPYKQLICNMHVQYMQHTRQNIAAYMGHTSYMQHAFIQHVHLSASLKQVHVYAAYMTHTRCIHMPHRLRQQHYHRWIPKGNVSISAHIWILPIIGNNGCLRMVLFRMHTILLLYTIFSKYLNLDINVNFKVNLYYNNFMTIYMFIS